MKGSPVGPARTALTNIEEEEDADGDNKGNKEAKSTRELESQKARIVAQMVPSRTTTFPVEEDVENIPLPQPLAPSHPPIPEARQPVKSVKLVDKHPTQPPISKPTFALSLAPGPQPPVALPKLGDGVKPSTYDVVAQTLSIAFEAKAAGKLFRDPGECQFHLE